MPTLLVVDDEPNILLCFQRAFRGGDLRIVTAESGAEGLRLASAELPDVIVLDLCLPDQSGLEVFRQLRVLDPKCLVIFITAHGTTETAIEATKDGAFDYLLKPLDVPMLRDVVERAVRIRRMMHVPALFAQESPMPTGADLIVGRCPAMQAVYKSIGRVASQNVSVLVTGESGTGKELVARAIYQHSGRHGRPFMAVNCAAIPDALLESELFGHEQGAFTGADRRRIGKFEQCDGATLFLDEVGDLSPALQAKLLRVLQDRSFHRVGSNEELRTDVRIIAATNQILEQMVEEGAFRRDLYFRLANFTIHLPPLRDRLDDLPALVHHIVSRLNQQLGTDIDVIPEETLARLAQCAWPGNIRELENCLRTSLLHATGRVLLPEFLAEPGVENRLPPGSDNGGDHFRKTVLELLERGETGLYAQLVRRLDALVLHLVMEHTCGNQVQASRILGITRSTLRAKLQVLATDDAGEKPIAECRA